MSTMKGPDPDLQAQIQRLEQLFSVPTDLLHKITNHFISELKKGLSVEGGNIPMVPTWCMSVPDGHESGTFLAIDMGGTNLRVCEIKLLDEFGKFDNVQSKFRMPEELKHGKAEELWGYVADCLKQFIDTHHGDEDLEQLPLGFTFSYPVSQENIDQGVLQRWTKGFDVDGVEGHDVVPQFEAALQAKNVPIKLMAIVNDTVGTLMASAYTDPAIRIGCIFGTGCNAAYMDYCGNVPKLAHMKLPADMPISINCEWGAFDNEHQVLPRTPYDVIIDEQSPRPGQQTFEKMVAGLYLGEILRLTLLDLHENPDVVIFADQDVEKLRKPYTLDSSFLSDIEEDATESLTNTLTLFQTTLSLHPSPAALTLIRRLAQLIGTRAARLTACGIAAICKKQQWTTVHVGADGSLFIMYPHFQQRQAQALKELFGWADEFGHGPGDPVEVRAAEDGSGVGAALIAALTIERVKQGNWAGIRDPKGMLEGAKRQMAKVEEGKAAK